MKVKSQSIAIQILGTVFTILGSVFLMITAGALFSYAADFIDKRFMLPFALSFGITGVIFFLAGITFLFLFIHKNHIAKKLVAQGHYIQARIMDCQPTLNYNYKGGRLYRVSCMYQDIQGISHIFYSSYLNINPEGLFTNDTVKVYCTPDDFKRYYVAIEEVLPKVVLHKSL